MTKAYSPHNPLIHIGYTHVLYLYPCFGQQLTLLSHFVFIALILFKYQILRRPNGNYIFDRMSFIDGVLFKKLLKLFCYCI